MSSYEFTREEFSRVFDGLRARCSLYGPRRFPGRGRFTNTDLVKYAQLNGLEELELEEKSYMSPKSLAFPADETLFYFTGQEFAEAPQDGEGEIVVFLRPCDINGFRRLDAMFLENGGTRDPYYQRRRERLRFFMIECTESFDNCFCVSMKSNTADDYSAALRFSGDSVLVEVKDDEFEGVFSAGRPSGFKPEFVRENRKRVDVPDVDEMPPEMFAHPMWDEYDQRCIACGRCNTSCVTCTCFSTRDLFYSDSRLSGERRRVWDGCHLDGFTEMAGGASYREKKGARMRFKTFHKIYDFRKRFGYDMCVGCGRCDDVCPEYISFAECINKVSATLKEVEGR